MRKLSTSVLILVLFYSIVILSKMETVEAVENSWIISARAIMDHTAPILRGYFFCHSAQKEAIPSTK